MKVLSTFLVLALFLGSAHLQNDPTPVDLSDEDFQWIEQQMINWTKEIVNKKLRKRRISHAGEDKTSFGSESLRVDYELELESGPLFNTSVIMTRLPSTPGRYQQINDTGLMKTEIQFYKEITPLFWKMMSEVEDNSNPTWPEPFGYRDDYTGFVLEDIETQYRHKRAERTEGLDLKHSKLALATLAKYHAMTAKLSQSQEVNMTENFDKSFLERDQAKIGNYYEEVLNNLASSMEEKWGSEWADAAQKIKEKSKTVTEDLLKLLERNDNAFNVLNHGSISTDNIFFCYGDSDVYVSPDPVSVMMDNYKMAFYNSPAMDLQFFINTSPTIDVMMNNRDDLVKAYFDSLERFLKRFSYEGKLPTYEDIQKELERTEFIGLVDAINHLPHMYLTPEEIQDLEKTLEENSKTNKIAVANKGLDGDKFVANMKLILKRAMDKNVI